MNNFQIFKSLIPFQSNISKKDQKQMSSISKNISDKKQYQKKKEKQQKNITKTIQFNKCNRLNGNITLKPQGKYDYMLKLILVGDSGVGKTNLIQTFCHHKKYQNQIQKTRAQKNTSYIPTIGVDFSTKIIQIQNKKIKLQIWDTAGQERFKTITQTYYRGAAGIILVYSVGNQSSFRSIQKWLTQINEKASKCVKKILVANKSDLPEIKKVQQIQQKLKNISQNEQLDQKFRTVPKRNGLELANQHQIQYFQVSALKNQRVDQVFYYLSQQIKAQIQIQRLNDNESDPEEPDNVRITLEDKNKSISRRKRRKNGIDFQQDQKQIKTEQKGRKILKCNC